MQGLFIDLGNSRLKWRWLAGDRVEQGVVSSPDWSQAAFWPELPAGTSVWIAAVGAHAVRAALAEALQQRTGRPPCFAVSDGQRGAVRNAYQEPTRLGVDRWLALLAARQQQSGRVLVLDSGSALTLDVLDADGQHRGGHIAPGWPLLRAALRSGTADLRPGDAVPVSVTPGLNTAAAIDHGCLCMLQGYLHRMLAEPWARDATLLLTGGDAELLLPVAPPGSRLCKDLVLDGLLLWAADEQKEVGGCAGSS